MGHSVNMARLTPCIAVESDAGAPCILLKVAFN